MSRLSCSLSTAGPCYDLCPVRPLRFWLVDGPARITEVGFTWYRLYMLVVLFIAGPGLILMALTVLVLWFGFGIRWGW